MANATKTFTVVIAGDDRTKGAFDSANKSAEGFGHTVGKAAKVAVLGLAAVGVAGIAIGKQFYDAAIESQKVTKQTEAVIKSMGNASNISANEVAKLSTQLSNKTAVDDELIQSGANVLLTFGNVRNEMGKGNDIFNRATTAALDMSVALGTDMKGAAIQMGKALNDPVKGMTALSKAGVSFTEEQKEQVKAMVKSGDVLGAQKLILSELDKQFAGSAASQATGLDRLKVVWGNLQEQLGEKLIPVVEKVAGWLGQVLPGVIDVAMGAFSRIGAVVSQLWGILALGDFKSGPFAEDSTLVDVLFRIRDAFFKVAGFVTETFLPAIVAVGKWVLDHKPVLIGLAVAVGVGLTGAFLSWAAAATAAAAATVVAMAPVIAIGLAIAAVTVGLIWAYQNWGWFRDAVDTVARFLTETVWPALKEGARIFTETVWPAIQKVVSILGDGLIFWLKILKFEWDVAWKVVSTSVQTAWKVIEPIINFIKEAIDKLMGPLNAFIGAAGKVGGFIGGIGGGGINKNDFKPKAAGGPVSAGGMYLVGERGPELFAPGMSGSIIPNHALGGGGMVVNVNFNGVVGDPAEAGRAVVDVIRQHENRNGASWRAS